MVSNLNVMFWSLIIGALFCASFFALFARQYNSLQRGGWRAVGVTVVVALMIRIIGGILV